MTRNILLVIKFTFIYAAVLIVCRCCCQHCRCYCCCWCAVVVGVVAGVYVVSFACFVSQRREISENSSHLWHEVGLEERRAAKAYMHIVLAPQPSSSILAVVAVLFLLLSVWAEFARCVA